MMGERQVDQGALFYEFWLEKQVPTDHMPARLTASSTWARCGHYLAPFYSTTGRPSMDPELLIRMLIIGYCYGIRSERRLCEEVHLNLAYRWFCRLGLAGEVPDHSTLSKNRHIRASLVTAMPALLLALLGFWLLGSPGEFDTSGPQAAIAASYEVTAWAFVPLVVVVVLSVLRVPPFLAILGGALAGGVMAVLLQPGLVLQYAARPDLPNLDRSAQGRLGGPGDRLCLPERRSQPGHPALARRHGKHAQHHMVDHGRPWQLLQRRPRSPRPSRGKD